MTVKTKAFKTADEYIAQRLDGGVRDPGVIAKEMLGDPDLRRLLVAVVRSYVSNRIRSRVRAIENSAGRGDEVQAHYDSQRRHGLISPSGRQDPGRPINAALHQRDLLGERLSIPNHGYVLYADLTVEMLELRIEWLESINRGNERSIRYYRLLIAEIQAAGVQTLGEAVAAGVVLRDEGAA